MGITLEEPIHPEAASEEWVRRLLAALNQGNVDTVISMLANDVVLVSDGGGKAFAVIHPIESRDHVARFLLGLSGKAPLYEGGMHIELSDINGQTGLVVRSDQGIETVALMHVERNLICNFYFIRNPDKLKYLLK